MAIEKNIGAKLSVNQSAAGQVKTYQTDAVVQTTSPTSSTILSNSWPVTFTYTNGIGWRSNGFTWTSNAASKGSVYGAVNYDGPEAGTVVIDGGSKTVTNIRGLEGYSPSNTYRRTQNIILGATINGVEATNLDNTATIGQKGHSVNEPSATVTFSSDSNWCTPYPSSVTFSKSGSSFSWSNTSVSFAISNNSPADATLGQVNGSLSWASSSTFTIGAYARSTTASVEGWSTTNASGGGTANAREATITVSVSKSDSNDTPTITSGKSSFKISQEGGEITATDPVVSISFSKESNSYSGATVTQDSTDPKKVTVDFGSTNYGSDGYKTGTLSISRDGSGNVSSLGGSVTIIPSGVTIYDPTTTSSRTVNVKATVTASNYDSSSSWSPSTQTSTKTFTQYGSTGTSIDKTLTWSSDQSWARFSNNSTSITSDYDDNVVVYVDENSSSTSGSSGITGTIDAGITSRHNTSKTDPTTSDTIYVTGLQFTKQETSSTSDRTATISVTGLGITTAGSSQKVTFTQNGQAASTSDFPTSNWTFAKSSGAEFSISDTSWSYKPSSSESTPFNMSWTNTGIYVYSLGNGYMPGIDGSPSISSSTTSDNTLFRINVTNPSWKSVGDRYLGKITVTNTNTNTSKDITIYKSPRSNSKEKQEVYISSKNGTIKWGPNTTSSLTELSTGSTIISSSSWLSEFYLKIPTYNGGSETADSVRVQESSNSTSGISGAIGSSQKTVYPTCVVTTSSEESKTYATLKVTDYAVNTPSSGYGSISATSNEITVDGTKLGGTSLTHDWQFRLGTSGSWSTSTTTSGSSSAGFVSGRTSKQASFNIPEFKGLAPSSSGTKIYASTSSTTPTTDTYLKTGTNDTSHSYSSSADIKLSSASSSGVTVSAAIVTDAGSGSRTYYFKDNGVRTEEPSVSQTGTSPTFSWAVDSKASGLGTISFGSSTAQNTTISIPSYENTSDSSDKWLATIKCTVTNGGSSITKYFEIYAPAAVYYYAKFYRYNNGWTLIETKRSTTSSGTVTPPSASSTWDFTISGDGNYSVGTTARWDNHDSDPELSNHRIGQSGSHSALSSSDITVGNVPTESWAVKYYLLYDWTANASNDWSIGLFAHNNGMQTNEVASVYVVDASAEAGIGMSHGSYSAWQSVCKGTYIGQYNRFQVDAPLSSGTTSHTIFDLDMSDTSQASWSGNVNNGAMAIVVAFKFIYNSKWYMLYAMYTKRPNSESIYKQDFSRNYKSSDYTSYGGTYPIAWIGWSMTTARITPRIRANIKSSDVRETVATRWSVHTFDGSTHLTSNDNLVKEIKFYMGDNYI